MKGRPRGRWRAPEGPRKEDRGCRCRAGKEEDDGVLPLTGRKAVVDVVVAYDAHALTPPKARRCQQHRWSGQLVHDGDRARAHGDDVVDGAW